MDMSRVPDLELRRKVKPINDRMDTIDAEIERIEQDFETKSATICDPIRDRLNLIRAELTRAREAEAEKARAACKQLRDERDKLEGQLNELLGEDRCIEGTCHLTGLPIFTDDETTEFTALSCVSDEKKAAA